MKKILITGGAGFIGSKIADLLDKDKNNHITILDDLSKGNLDDYFVNIIEKKNVDFIEKDLSKKESLNDIKCNFDQVYHLAAIVGVRKVTENPVKTIKVNTQSTFNLLDYISESNKKPKLLFTSSCENYAGTMNRFSISIPTPEDVPLCIEDIKNPRWTYAASKILGEVACYHYAKEFQFEITIIRYHNVYGPRMGTQHVIPEFILRLKQNGQEFHLYGGNQFRAFCYISDAALMTINLMEEQKANGLIVNIGNDKDEVKIQDIAKMICSEMNLNPIFREHGAPKGSVKRRVPDLSLIKKLHCFVYNIPLKKGIQETVKWYLHDYK